MQSFSTRRSSFPYLFTLGLEGFSLRIKKADQMDNIDGVPLQWLIFILLMICSCFVKQIFLKYAWAKKECLEDFQVISCQSINYGMSTRFIFPLLHHECIWIFSKILHMKSSFCCIYLEAHLLWLKKNFPIYACW